MSAAKKLSDQKIKKLQNGRIFVPSPLALSKDMVPWEPYQRLLTLYYIRAGVASVIPGAHTGEFALNNTEIFKNWLLWVKEMTEEFGQNMLLMAAIGGKDYLRQAEIASELEFDLVMVAPTAFTGKSEDDVVQSIDEIAAMIPVFGFELQRAIPGAYEFSAGLWSRLFNRLYGAKGASFDTYRSITMLEAAAKSDNRDMLSLLTGNDDRIVSDLMGRYLFRTKSGDTIIQYHGGLLGHFATDTHAVVNWVNNIFEYRQTGQWNLSLPAVDLAHAVNLCNMALFDALGNFENSVWGVKYRLTRLGLLSAPYCRHENGRPGQAEAIDRIYGQYPELCDNEFLRDHLSTMKNELGIRE